MQIEKTPRFVAATRVSPGRPPSLKAVCLLFLGIFLLSASALSARPPTTTDGETPRRYWQFLFLFESTNAPGQSEFVIRPLIPIYSHYANYERGYEFNTVLYPIFWSHGTFDWKKWTFLFFFTGDDTYHEDTKDDTDLMLSPLFSWGRGETERERYVSFFPFYGRIRNKLGWSEINFVMFPFYVNWSHKEYKAHGILWPIIMWGGDDVRSDLRIFPFYSSKIHQGKYVHRTVLWPFVQWGTDDMDKRDPRSYFLFFPFYGHKWSESGELNVHSIGWPISIVSWGRDRKVGAYEFRLLTFIYQYGYSETPLIRKHIFFPFYGYYRFNNYEFTFVTPFYHNLKTHSLIMESDYTFLIPFYTQEDRYYRRERTQEWYLKVWPFFNYMEDTRGNLSFRTLDLLWPWRSDTWDRLWGPVWSIVEYRTMENGDKYFSLFLRIYSQYWNDEEFHLFFLGFEFHRTRRYWSFEFLGGLFGFRRDYPDLGKPENTVRLFWLNL